MAGPNDPSFSNRAENQAATLRLRLRIDIPSIAKPAITLAQLAGSGNGGLTHVSRR